MGIIITTSPSGNIYSGMSLNSTFSRTSLEKFTFELQSKIDRDWDNCSDRYIIGEETVFGSKIFNDVEVRINHEVVSDVGVRLGDDWKIFIFKNIDHARGMGFLYSFGQNLYLTMNTDFTKSLTASTVVRRLNNTLRWIDENGIIYNEPCAIEPIVSRTNNKTSTEDIVIAQGLSTIYCQLNARTNLIKENQRFLFGNPSNWRSFRVLGNGVRNYLNNQTMDNTTCTYLELKVEAWQGNTADDNLTLGIADFYKYTTSGSVSNSITVSPGNFDILEGTSQTYNVTSSPASGSFVFSVADNYVPVGNYVFNSLSGNSFIVSNVSAYFDSSLNINCIGVSGSRVINLNLNGAW